MFPTILENVSHMRRQPALWREETENCSRETHEHPQVGAYLLLICLLNNLSLDYLKIAKFGFYPFAREYCVFYYPHGDSNGGSVW